jgi:ABC-type uncharacterized transport system auxiliary subunit
MPTTIQIVAVTKNMTGICHVIICKTLGARLPIRSDRLPLLSSLRILARPSRCEDRRCRRTVWSAALMMLSSERMMPQYQDVRTGQGDFIPLGRMVGQLPVDVRTPASRAD